MITSHSQCVTACPLSLDTTPSPMARRRHQVPLRNSYSHNLKWRVIRLSQKCHNWNKIGEVMNPYPAPRSVLILDNCRIHHVDGVKEICNPSCVSSFLSLLWLTHFSEVSSSSISHRTHRTSIQLKSAFLRSNTTLVTTDKNSAGSARVTTRQLHMCSCTMWWIR
jgi:hypothetical protein